MTAWRARALILLVALVGAVLGGGPASAAGSAGPGGTGGAGGGEVERAPAPAPSKTSFDRQGMWIWYVDRSQGGDLAAIVRRAKRSGIGTVYVKAGDGTHVWSQFNGALVAALHRGGLDACAWQFVYGTRPVAEARVAIAAARRGADCLAIDAESQYEGRYAAAERYVRTLRAGVGGAFPVSLASFPYVDYHPAFPYSVFLGPGGATYNQPQMYWKAIQTSVRAVYEHTYIYNRLWGRPIYPLGQTYEEPGSGALRRFRRFAASYGGQRPSWWDWQETNGREWGALGASSANRPLQGYRPTFSQPLLKRGSRGDLVVWAQEHLLGAGEAVPVNGVFGKRTIAAVRGFQRAHGLAASGVVETATWRPLLRVRPQPMRWAAAAGSTAGTGAASAVTSAAATGASGGPRRPLSASLPARAYEIGPEVGAR